MPLDPQAQAFLDKQATLGAKPIWEISADEAREQVNRGIGREPRQPVAETVNVWAPGPNGDIPLRLYRPEGDGPFPVLLFYHGGGWVTGGIENSDHTCRALANGGGCLVVSVDYRMAPEHAFPAAAEDSFAALEWAAKHADDYGGDPGRVAVSGVSAGGNLAAAMALMARDRGRPPLAHQLLIVPVLDSGCATESYTTNADGYGLSNRAMAHYWQVYCTKPGDLTHPYASPAHADDLGGLPPAQVITAEFDPLRDEGMAYAERLRAAGVAATAKTYPGMIHSFVSNPSAMDLGKQALAAACAELRRVFA